MSGALEIAAVGLRAQQRALETIAGNISNVNTPAFKRSDLRFSELVTSPIGTLPSAVPDFVDVVGVGQSSRPMVDEPGKIEITGSDHDLAIDGSGFVEIMGPAGQTLLWRGGTFRVLEDGMLATGNGIALKAGIVVPADAASLRIDRDGTVHAVGADGQVMRYSALVDMLGRRMTDAQRQALVDVVESGSIPAIHGAVRWRLIDLAQWLHDEFAVSLDETTISRELKKLGYVKLTARPRHHAQNDYALEAFKKGASLPSWQRSKTPSRRARP